MKSFLFIFLLTVAQVFGATYYVDYNAANDSANGTSTATPWKRAPGMVGFAGSYSHSSGDRFIFKGGVTWSAACFEANIPGSGTAGNVDYYGVDATWYTGGSWSRPVFDGSYTATSLLYLSTSTYITIDNIEFKRIDCPGDNYALIGLAGGRGVTIQNCYLHGWRTSSGTDGQHGGIINVGGGYTNVDEFIIDNCEIENSENIGVQKNGLCVRAAGTIRNNSKIHDNSSGVLFCLDFNGSQLYNITGDPFDGVYHPNGVYCDPVALSHTTGYIRNSYLHDVAGGANMAYPVTRNGCNIYVYNNVLYGTQSTQDAINVDPDMSGGETEGNCYVYENTIVVYTTSAPAIHVTDRSGFGFKVGILTIQNNHIIGTTAIITDGGGSTVTTLTQTTNLNQSVATATSQGYVLGNLYAPTSTSNGTYNTGTTDVTTGSTADIIGVSRPQAIIWDIGAYEFVSGVAYGGAVMSGAFQISGAAVIK